VKCHFSICSVVTISSNGRNLLQAVDVQLLWEKMLNQCLLPCDDGKDWRDMGLKSMGRDLLTTLWAEPKRDIWERAGLDMDCNPIFSTNHPIKCGYPSLTRTHITIRLVVRKSSMYLVLSFFVQLWLRSAQIPARTIAKRGVDREVEEMWQQLAAAESRVEQATMCGSCFTSQGRHRKWRQAAGKHPSIMLFHFLAFGWFGNHYSIL